MGRRQARVVAAAALLATAAWTSNASAGQAAPALTGVVRTTAGAPVPAATVTVVGLAKPAVAVAATTDGAGAFSLSSVVLPVDLDVIAAGFAPVRVRVSRSPVEIFVVPFGLTESVIVQTSFRNESIMRDALTGSTWLVGDDLRSLPAVTLDETLRAVSGFSLFRRSSSRSANPTTHGVTMRGLSASGASRGLVVMDGTPLNDGFGGWVTWTRVPDLALASVEVDRGPQGDAFGSDALGGVIRLVPNAWAPVVASAAIGNHGVASLDGAAGAHRSRRAVFGAVSWFDTDGSIPVAPESRGAVDQAADATWFNALGRGEIRREPMHLTLLAWGGRDDRGNGTVKQRNRMSGATVAATVTADVAPATIVSARVSYSPNTFDQTFSIVASGRGSESVNSTQRTETSTSRAMVEVARGLPRSMLFLRGSIQRAAADFSDARATGTTVLALDDAGESVSAHFETVPVGRLTTSAGVRHEWRAAPTALDARDRATVGHLGASVRVTDTVAIRGAVASSHRWPTLNELVRDFQVGAVRTLSNSDLDPERARTAEVGVGYTRGRSASLSATVFRTVVDDAIANVTIPSTSGIVRQRRNAGETRATGLELDGQWARGRTTLRGSVTLTDASFATSDEPAIDGNRLPQIPRASASVWADVAISSRLRSTVFWQGASTQFDDDRNTFELGSASQVGVRVGGPVGRIEWSLAFENLFDNRIEVGRTPLVTLAPGREIRFSVTWKQ